MDHSSSSSFSNLLNSHISPEAPNPNTQQYPDFQTFHQQQQYPMNYSPNNLHISYPQNISNPFGGPLSLQPFSFPPPAYHGIFHSNGPAASPIGSMPFYGPSCGSNSRSDESSPIASSSPASRAPPMESTPAQIQVDSESSTDDGEKQGGRKLWREENLRLVSAWLKNSNDPIDGNGKPRDRFWKEIDAEYNKTAPKHQRRTANQCKEHWHKNMPVINKFNGIYNDVKNRNASGQYDDQLIKEVRAKWKGLMKKKRPFPLEHWWAAVKDQHKSA